MYYKVLVEGRSCHGGDLAWSLPQDDQPGEWHEVAGRIEVCHNGLHLTTAPLNWMAPEGRVYLAEGDGASDTDGDKAAFARARLLRELTDPEYHALQIYRSGAHVVHSGQAWASGSTTVRAYDSGTVEASDSATVEASGSATVRASDSATVWASGSATVISTPSHSPTAQVTLARLAAHVDRRSGTLVLRSAMEAQP